MCLVCAVFCVLLRSPCSCVRASVHILNVRTDLATQAELQAERASAAAAQSDDGALRHDFDRLLAASVAAREEAAMHKVAEAEQAVEAAVAQARCVL